MFVSVIDMVLWSAYTAVWTPLRRLRLPLRKSLSSLFKDLAGEFMLSRRTESVRNCGVGLLPAIHFLSPFVHLMNFEDLRRTKGVCCRLFIPLLLWTMVMGAAFFDSLVDILEVVSIVLLVPEWSPRAQSPSLVGQYFFSVLGLFLCRMTECFSGMRRRTFAVDLSVVIFC